MNKHKQISPLDDSSDDFNVLNYLLEHVRGISPSSLTPHFMLSDDELASSDILE